MNPTEKVKEYLKPYGLDTRVLELPVSSATVALAAAALHTEERRIAKTMSFHVHERVIVVVLAGDARIDNHKYKETFGCKARMLSAEEVSPLTGHVVGGVCPFALPEGTCVYLDESLKRFETVFPACGSANSAIEVTLPQLERASCFTAWVDVSKLPEDTQLAHA